MIIIIISLLFLLSSSTADVDCPTLTTCDDCLANWCGWCTNSSKCFNITAGGWIIGGTCEDGYFHRSGCCEKYTTCESCRQDGDCGWCYGTNTCIHKTGGNYPLDGGCPEGWLYYVTNFNFLTYKQGPCCHSAKNCMECLSDAYSENCGWCYSANQCQISTYGGYAAETCEGSYWKRYGTCCTEVYDNCEQCVSDASGGCGWCNSKKKCIGKAGYGNWPQQGGCDQEWYPSSCCYDNCELCDTPYHCAFCKVGYYKEDCSQLCPSNCLLYSNTMCDMETGNCLHGCNDTHFYGPNCDIHCRDECVMGCNTQGACLGCPIRKCGEKCDSDCGASCTEFQEKPLCQQDCTCICKPGSDDTYCENKCENMQCSSAVLECGKECVECFGGEVDPELCVPCALCLLKAGVECCDCFLPANYCKQ